MSLLFTPYELGGIEIKNRVAMPPMCMYSADINGCAKDFHVVHYGARAIGGVGLIIVEATAIEPRGRITDSDLGLWDESQVDGHKMIVDMCHKFDSKIALQIAHAGRKSNAKESTPLAPSALKFSEDASFKLPKEATLEDIEEIKEKFVKTAILAKEAGYDALELHSAHGYLLSEFLSPLTNKRTDRYGGALENRCAMTLEIAQKMKSATNLPLIVRISADEWMDGGWSVDDSVYLSKKLKEAGVDMISVSAGGNHEKQQNIPKLTPFYQAEYAKRIKKEAQIPVIVVGIITKPSEAEALLLGEVCDLVAIGRELLRNPNFVQFAAKEFLEKEAIVRQYARAF